MTTDLIARAEKALEGVTDDWAAVRIQRITRYTKTPYALKNMPVKREDEWFCREARTLVPELLAALKAAEALRKYEVDAAWQLAEERCNAAVDSLAAENAELRENINLLTANRNELLGEKLRLIGIIRRELGEVSST
jgi:hypothetical protein